MHGKAMIKDTNGRATLRTVEFDDYAEINNFCIRYNKCIEKDKYEDNEIKNIVVLNYIDRGLVIVKTMRYFSESGDFITFTENFRNAEVQIEM